MMHPSFRSDLPRLANILKVLGDQNRLHILSLLRHHEFCVCEITSILKISQSNASQHLAKLRSVDLVKERKNAQWVYYSLNSETFPFIIDILETLPDIPDELKKIKELSNHTKCEI